MTSRKKIASWIFLIGLVAAAIVALNWPREKEPVYDGKKLSEWCDIYWDGTYNSENEMTTATKAVNAIGTNAIPFLLEWIKSGEHRSDLALCGFTMLGTNGAPAIPVLSQVATNDSQLGIDAVAALGRIGEPALPTLLAILTVTSSPNRGTVANYVAKICLDLRVKGKETNGLSAVPILLTCTRDKDQQVAGEAAVALSGLHLQANKVVPALTNMLSNPDSFIRKNAVDALLWFGNAARPAIPILQSMTNDPDSQVREAVTRTLEQITSSPP